MNKLYLNIIKNKYWVLALISAFFWIIWSHYFSISLDSMNAEVVLFNYTYGLIPRAFIGHIYYMLGGTNSFHQVLTFLIIEHIILTFIIIGCWYFIIKKAPRFKHKKIVAFIVPFSIIASFTSRANLGRSDEVLIAIAMLSTVILITDKFLFLLPVLAIIGELTHEGFTFLYANVLLAGLAYRFLTTKKKKYAICFAASFIMISIWFLYFAFIGNHNETAYYNIGNKAYEMMGRSFYKNFLDAEFLGVNLFKEELKARPRAFIELGFYIIIMYPFVEKVIRYIVALLKSQKMHLIILGLGWLTLLPEYLLKLDFGRWTMALLIYLILVTLIALSYNDEDVLSLFEKNILDNWGTGTLSYTKIGFLITNPFGAQAVCEATLALYKFFHYFF